MSFKIRIQEIADEEDIPIPATPKHWKEAEHVAQKYGTEVVLAAFRGWLTRDNLAEELRIGQTIGTGYEQRTPIKTWLLHEFLNSPSGLAEIRKASRYGQRPSHRIIGLLIEHSVSPEELSEGHYQALQWIEEHGLLPEACSAFGTGTNISEFLATAPEWCRKHNEKLQQGYTQRVAAAEARGNKAALQYLLVPKPFNDKAWQGYQQFARLLMAEPMGVIQ